MKREKKKQTEQNEENKNPLHKEYGVFKNMGFVLKHMIGYDKKILVLILPRKHLKNSKKKSSFPKAFRRIIW